jgi:hypothetical protein
METWEKTDSSMNKALRDDARKAAEEAIEHFAAYQVRFNEKMTETQKYELLGVRTWHKGHPINVPGTVPELSPRSGHIRQVIVYYRDLGTERWGKPDKVHGIEILIAILDHPPGGHRSGNDHLRLRHPPALPQNFQGGGPWQDDLLRGPLGDRAGRREGRFRPRRVGDHTLDQGTGSNGRRGLLSALCCNYVKIGKT